MQSSTKAAILPIICVLILFYFSGDQETMDTIFPIVFPVLVVSGVYCMIQQIRETL